MLGNFGDVVKCSLCQGTLEASIQDTEDDYSTIMNTTHENIFDNVENILCRHIVYRCTSCNNKVRYTYKSLEKAFRKGITKRFLMLVGQGAITTSAVFGDKYFIYCGKCNGLDGSGSCPKTIYEKCEIKRFPVDEL